MLDSKKMRLLESRIDSFRIRDKDADDRKVLDEVFDKQTLLALYKLFNDKVINTLEFVVSTGKEGNVFMATSNEGDCAVKIYRISTATFRNISRYMAGDPRFKGVYGSHKKAVMAWAKKEFKNLSRMYAAGVSVPKPKDCRKNILVMEYISEDGQPARSIKETKLKAPTKIFKKVVANMKFIQEAGLVHGDLSEYNILMRSGEPIIIDVGQAVTLDHPSAEEWFLRDVRNIANYFTKVGVRADPDEMIKEIRGG